MIVKPLRGPPPWDRAAGLRLSFTRRSHSSGGEGTADQLAPEQAGPSLLDDRRGRPREKSLRRPREFSGPKRWYSGRRGQAAARRRDGDRMQSVARRMLGDTSRAWAVGAYQRIVSPRGARVYR